MKKSKPVRTVKVPPVPTLKEFLDDVLYFQKKYLSPTCQTTRSAKSFRFTALLHSGDINAPYFNATAAKACDAVLAALVFAQENPPEDGEVKLIVRARLKGCCFDQMIPCAIGQKLVEEAAPLVDIQAAYRC